MESGIRVDQLDGSLSDRYLRLWKGIQHQLADEAMPPDDELQPTAKERTMLVGWIERAIVTARSRVAEKNGSIRRLTVNQYHNTLRDLLGLRDKLTDVLPPDAVSKDGFVNNHQTMLLSPLLLEAYFDVAEHSLDLCIVDEDERPSIQNFRMDLGAAVNPEPCPDKLILGALSMLLKNDDFIVTQLEPEKPFAYDPFFMQTKYRFIEGYQGNATVRGWRDFDSIYHAVFACVRGNGGYPQGLAYQTVPAGLLLRPAIPSAELFQVESTYGPQANFKISLRELPDRGVFRVTVKAAKYDDGLLFDPGAVAQPVTESSVTAADLREPRMVQIPRGGVYQADVYVTAAVDRGPAADDSKLAEGLIGSWSLDGDAIGKAADREFPGRLEGEAKFVDSPFQQAISLDGKQAAVVAPRDEAMNVSDGDFTVAAWIHPRELRQAGVVSLGGYGYTHGWLLDMPNGTGVLRIETSKPNNQSNGTVQSRPGVIRRNTWQHVAAVVRRGDNRTRLYVNGFDVGVGSIQNSNLDNPKAELHIGRIPGANLFAGEIDEVRLYRRALDVAELKALIEPGKQFAKAPPAEPPKNLALRLGERRFAAKLSQPAFITVRLDRGPLRIAAEYEGHSPVNRVVLTRLDDDDPLAQEFTKFAARSPRIGVHVGLRRDCGSTLTQVGAAQAVFATEMGEFVFEDAINNYPSPDVEKNNVNYLAGVREIGVRSEYTDGRPMPRLLIRSVEFEGPYYESWPPRTHKDIFIESPNRDDPPVYAREIIRSFATRAFRRPLDQTEEDAFFAVWRSSFAETGEFQQSIKDSLLVALTSPQFLFIIENSETPDAEMLSEWELASKLSYFLWNTSPDDRLLSLAASKSLRNSLDDEITRMIADPRFRQFTGDFVSQWLSLEKFDVVEIDRNRYPRLTRDTKTQLRQEPVEYMYHLMRHNLGISHVIESDFIVANEVVAAYYGLGGKTENGFEFTPIPHADRNLGGLLTQAGILAGLSNGRESNPVKRGAWLARKIIAEPPDDPPPNVPALDADLSNLSLREQLAKHRNQKGCAKCHAGIDPWGLPFEEFDAGGLFKKKLVDARATLPDKTEVAGLDGLRKYLVNDRIDQVAFSFLKHLATYAAGRTLTYNETEFLREQSGKMKSGGYPAQDMIRFVVKSDLFMQK
jgi:hypothetical protein